MADRPGARDWLATYYPTPAEKAAKKPWLAAVRHSILKWGGLSRRALKKHRLSPSGRNIVDESRVEHSEGCVCSQCHMSRSHVLRIDAHTCAMCIKADAMMSCERCPIVKLTGETCAAEYSCWTIDGDPGPMLRLLRRTEKYLLEKGKAR